MKFKIILSIIILFNIFNIRSQSTYNILIKHPEDEYPSEMIETVDNEIILAISILGKCPQIIKVNNEGNIIDSLLIPFGINPIASYRIPRLKQLNDTSFIAMGYKTVNDSTFLWLGRFTNTFQIIKDTSLYVEGNILQVTDFLIKDNNSVSLVFSTYLDIVDGYIYFWETDLNFNIIKTKVYPVYGSNNLVFDLSIKNNQYYCYSYLGFPTPKSKERELYNLKPEINYNNEFTENYEKGGFEICVTKLDTNYDKIYHKYLDHFCFCNDVKWLNDTVFLLSGRKYIGPKNFEKSIPYMGLLKMDTSFHILKQNTYNNSGDTTWDSPGNYKNIDGIDFNNIFYGGYLNNFPFNSIINLFKTDTSLNIKWKRYYGGDANYLLHSIIATNDGGCVMAGAKNVNETNSDVFLIKVNSDGNLSWVHNLPDDFMKLTVYPNPGSKQMILNNPPLHTKILLYDITGKLQKEQELDISNMVNTGELKTGIYFYTIMDEKGKIVAKGKWVKTDK